MRQRTRLFFLAACAAAALCFTSRAIAQGDEEAFSWTGFYLGGNVGGLSSDYGFSHFADEVDVDAQFAQLPDNDDLFGPSLNIANPDGFDDSFGIAAFSFSGAGETQSTGRDQSILGGGQGGYNRQFGHFVIGVEGDFQATSAGKKQFAVGFAETVRDTDPIPQGIFDQTAETTLQAVRTAESDWSASLRARLGYALGPVLFYATGGVAFTDLKVTASETASTNFFDQFTDGLAPASPNPNGGPGPGPGFIGNVTSTNFSKGGDDVEIGWTGGLGTEFAFNNKFSVGVEYRHSDYGSHTYQFTSNEGVIFPGDTKVDLETDQLTIRFNVLLSHFFGH